MKLRCGATACTGLEVAHVHLNYVTDDAIIFKSAFFWFISKRQHVSLNNLKIYLVLSAKI